MGVSFRGKRGGFRLPPATTARMDQEIAAATEKLDQAIVGHRQNRQGAGDESVAVARTVAQLWLLVGAHGQRGVTSVVDMLTLALSRLVDAPDVAAIVEELRQQAETHTVAAADCRSEMLAVQHAAEARAYRDAIRIIEQHVAD